jgi:glycosyltransferase involved in cell wall biosynthesis
MKVLYVGNYLDGTGWGNAALNNIIAMHRAGIDVVPRRISYGSSIVPNPEVQELEKKSAKNCDVCIQHCLPKDYFNSPQLKTIGIYHVECDNFKHSLWQSYINTMDEAWVCSNHTKSTSLISGVKIPIKSFRASIDFDAIDKVEQRPTMRIKELKDSYNFCFFGEFNDRKNLSALIKAFHLEFAPEENVNLFFKISGGDSEQSLKNLYRMNDEICASLKLHHAKKIRGLAGYLRYEDYLSLMSQCHCMVIPSYGEDPCIPIIEAQAIGLRIIYTSFAGMSCYAPTGMPVPSRQVPCVTRGATLPELYTGRDTWNEIEISCLRNRMRLAYQNNATKDFIKKSIRSLCSYEVAGKIFKELLCRQSENA